MQKFTGHAPRKVRGEQDSNVSTALALIQNNRSAAFYVGGSLQRAYSKFKGTTKIVARTANSNERSSENWLQSRVCPDVPHFLRLAMQVPELKSAVKWLQKVVPHEGDPYRTVAAYMVLAMAEQKLNQAEEARATFNKGVKFAEAKLTRAGSPQWNDYIAARLFMREAGALLGIGEGDSPREP